MRASTWIRLWVAVAACGVLLTLGCGDDGNLDGGEEPLVDSDGDGLYDNFEAQIGTDPALEDSDEDGYLDGDEWYTFSDPIDVTDYEYLDGDGNLAWDHSAYPTGLDGAGTEYGDVPAQFSLPNYWIQQVNLYSFYGDVIQIVTPADT